MTASYYPITSVHPSCPHTELTQTQIERKNTKRDREGKRNAEPEHQLLLQTTREPLRLPKSPNLNSSVLAANYSSSLVETKFMTPSWRSLWHHKLNWQRVLGSEPGPLPHPHPPAKKRKMKKWRM